MQRISTRALCTAIAALALATSTVDAQGKGKGHENGEGKKAGKVMTQKSGGEIASRRGVTTRKVPPGLAKKGGLPPGQAKKIYHADEGVVALRDIFGRRGYTVVRVVPSGSSRYVYYRMNDGTERRAIVRPGAERLTFVNVPGAIMQDVLARLY